MTEPVAYRTKDVSETLGWRYSTLQPVAKNYEPLYTSEQLHPRVKMTQKQYDRLIWDKENTDLLTCLGYFLEHDGVNKFGLPSENLMGFLKQEDIARAWLNPEETIEIVPDMKWFVRSTETGYNDFLLIDSERIHGWYPFVEKKIATQFDTKEQAELWTNPLTEAVQLPVEETK